MESNQSLTTCWESAKPVHICIRPVQRYWNGSERLYNASQNGQFPVAQWIACWNSILEVAGSNPVGGRGKFILLFCY